MRDLRGQSVLVVGASGSLGASIARVLDGRGARLCLAGRSEERLRALGLDAPRCVVDVRTPGWADVALDAARAAYGGVDGVVLATGVVAFGRAHDVPLEVVDALTAVNFRGPMEVLRAFAALPPGGFLVSLSGIVAEQAFPGLSAYGAGKAALSMATRAVALELRARGSLMIDARPGHTETGLATRPLHGTAPRMPAGLDPARVAERIVRAVEEGERDLPPAAFA